MTERIYAVETYGEGLGQFVRVIWVEEYFEDIPLFEFGSTIPTRFITVPRLNQRHEDFHPIAAEEMPSLLFHWLDEFGGHHGPPDLS